MTIDYQVQLIHFPNNVTKESVVENEDGTYTIFIESELSSIEQRKVFSHAMKHITGLDFEKIDVNKIEYAAHRLEFSNELTFV